MPVPNTMADLATLASSNYPAGTESIGNSLDDYLRSHAAIIRSTNAIASSTIAAASTVNLAGADGEAVGVTGTGTINSFGTGFSGCVREVTFTNVVTVVNSSNIQLPNAANITTVAGDIHVYRCKGPGVWQLVSKWRQQSGDITAALGYTPVNKAGDSMSGALSVNGGISSVGGITSTATVAGDVLQTAQNIQSTNAAMILGTASGGTIFLHPNGIGSSTGEATLNSSGDFQVAGNLISASDERLKTDVRPIGDAMQILLGLEGVRYKKDGKLQVGFIAQRTEKALPEVVNITPNGYLGVNYGPISAVLTEAVKDIHFRLEKAGI